MDTDRPSVHDGFIGSSRSPDSSGWRFLVHVQINDTTGGDLDHDEVVAAVTAALGPHHDRVTRVEIHLAHDAAGSARPPVRCTIEARPAGDAALAVTGTAPSGGEAVRATGRRLRNVLDRWAGRRDAFSRDSVRLARPAEEPATPNDPRPAHDGDLVP